MQPLINILIRTSNRPLLFKRLIRSIERQTYKNVRIVVSYDTKDKPEYIKTSKFTGLLINCYPTKELYKSEKAFYNRYCNDLLNEVHEGFAVVIDDDDYIQDKTALETIVGSLKEDACNLIQMSRNGRKKPLKAEIVHSKVGMPCLILHSKYKGISTIGGQTDSDYYWIKEVSEKLPINWIEKVLVCCDRRSMGVV